MIDGQRRFLRAGQEVVLTGVSEEVVARWLCHTGVQAVSTVVGGSSLKHIRRTEGLDKHENRRMQQLKDQRAGLRSSGRLQGGRVEMPDRRIVGQRS